MGDVYRSDKIPICGPLATGRYRRNRSLAVDDGRTKKRGKKKREKRERYLPFPDFLRDPLFASDPSPAGFLLHSGRRGKERRRELPARERGDASSSQAERLCVPFGTGYRTVSR
ncbi:hypothetical protein B296_00020871 [Ensete ventricosum]|uniref:Uncharacterized protein n=1 Tax=Ensete ventricosum TaxID=4639 RepID=A0A427A7H1_ENSVE|nr:hypothetical protein B296_00020871 [Ensete ventricosum]